VSDLPWSTQTDVIWELIELITDVNQSFTLEFVYTIVPILQRIYPENSHIKAKIRQQMQVLRDHKHVDFVDNNGTYRRLI